MNTTTIRTVTAVLAGAALLATTAGTASAAPRDTACVGTMSATEVAGDLMIPAGGTCVFSGGLVAGNVVVGKDAYLSLNGTPVDGNLTAAGTSNVSLDGQTVVSGTVTMDRSALSAREVNTGGVLSVHQSRVGAIRAIGREGAAAGLVDVRLQNASVVARSVNAQWANLSVLSATVRGNVDVTSGELGTVNLNSAKVYGRFTGQQAQTTVLCRTSFTGPVSFEDSQGLYVGDDPAGRAAPCGGNAFKSSLQVSGSRLGVFISNRVAGTADGSMNDQMVLRNNTFSGGAEGDFSS